MYGIYTVVLAAGLVAAIPLYAVRFGQYLPTLGGRLGLGAHSGDQVSIWIHAVSVGEVRAVEPLLTRIRTMFPNRRIVLSTTTPTGHALASSHADADLVVYFPFDLPGPIRRCIDRIRPEIVIIAETEIWPNFLRICGRRGIPVFLVNGRISDRSLGRYTLAARWLPRILSGFRLLAMQSDTDAERIRKLGAPADRVVVLGNLKYDDPSRPRPTADALVRVLAAPDPQSEPLIVAASTAEGEEILVLEAFARIQESIAGARLLLAPRRTERFDAVHQIVIERGFGSVRRSGISDGRLQPGEVLLLDSIGELSGVFEFASLVFMGGTLVPRGGHNILEPARFRRPILFGPHMENFREIARTFLDEGAAIQVSGADSLASQAIAILSDDALAARLGANALRVAEANRGATERTVRAIAAALPVHPHGTDS